jgi:hypothetical protein
MHTREIYKIRAAMMKCNAAMNAPMNAHQQRRAASAPCDAEQPIRSSKQQAQQASGVLGTSNSPNRSPTQ